MSIVNGIITAPVSIEDIKEILNESSNDIATLCKSNNINMWSKYKPVNLRKKFVPDTLNSDGRSWTAPSGKLGWWLGNNTVNDAALVIPLVSRNSDFDNNKAKWTYNKPYGGDSSPYRLSDFAGYWDEAQPPIYPSYPINTNEFFISQTATFSIWTTNTSEIDYPNQCVSLKDIVQILTQTTDGEVYPAIYLYNVTKKIGSYYSKPDPIDTNLDDEGYQFLVKFSSGAPISEGGCGFSCNVGDVIRVYLLLCTTGGVEDNYFFNSFSLQHSVYVGYKEYTLKSDKDKPYTYDTATINITEKTVNQRTDYAGQYILDGDGNIMLLAGIVEVSGKFKYTFSSSHPPKGMTYTIFAQYQDGNGDIFTCASEKKYVRQASTSTSYSFSNLGIMVYPTLENAENQEGGFRVEGIPLIANQVGSSSSIVATEIDLHVYFDPYEGDTLITAYNVSYNGNPLYSEGSFSSAKVINFASLDKEADEASTVSEEQITSEDVGKS